MPRILPAQRSFHASLFNPIVHPMIGNPSYLSPKNGFTRLSALLYEFCRHSLRWYRVYILCSTEVQCLDDNEAQKRLVQIENSLS
jgi:hypothetical protein